MTLSSLLQLLRSAPVPRRETRRARAESKSSGCVIEGPGFYVWDEDAKSAREWARELDGAIPRPVRGAGIR